MKHTGKEIPYEADELRELLARLVARILEEDKRGSPLHPTGEPRQTWNKHSPPELREAVEFLRT